MFLVVPFNLCNEGLPVFIFTMLRWERNGIYIPVSTCLFFRVHKITIISANLIPRRIYRTNNPINRHGATMQLTCLTPFLYFLPAIHASAVLPNTNTTQAHLSGTHSTPRRSPSAADPSWDMSNPDGRCQYHTNVRQECQEGKLNTYIFISRFSDQYDSFRGWSGAPTVGVPPVLYLPGVTITGPRLMKSLKARFESTWYGDHMWYSYNGPSWSDDDKKRCTKGDWTAGPLRCDQPASLTWRVSGFFFFSLVLACHVIVLFLANDEVRLMTPIALSSAFSRGRKSSVCAFAGISILLQAYYCH